MPSEYRDAAFIPARGDGSFPLFTYNCVKFPDCGWLAINRVPEAVVPRHVHNITVEVEYFWINPGHDGWIIIRSNGPNGEEQIAGNDINTHKPFFKADEWATWTLHLQNAHFGTRADGTDLHFYFGADPDDVCYIRSIKVYATETPEKYALFGAAELVDVPALELIANNRGEAYVTFDALGYLPMAGGGRLLGSPHSVEMLYVGTDGGQVEVDGMVYPCQKGDIFFVNPGQARGVRTAISGACSYLTFDIAALERQFRNSVLTDMMQRKKRFIRTVPGGHPLHFQLQTLCQGLVAAYASTSAYKEMRVQSLLIELLYVCCENELIEDVAGDECALPLQKTLEYMEEHMEDAITVGHLAAIAHLSEAYFARQFKQYTGVSPLIYLTQLRLERAAVLLRAGAGVTDAALEVGISNVGHFIRLFKRQYGVTPRQWTKKQEHRQMPLP